jgi:hypothetical protein
MFLVTSESQAPAGVNQAEGLGERADSADRARSDPVRAAVGAATSEAGVTAAH